MMLWNHQVSPACLLFIIVLFVVATTSAAQLVTMPRIFFDEATTIEIARNVQLFGVPDVLTAPGQFSGIPFITGSSGFPVSFPLAAFFKLFGFGFAQARIYALLWLLAFFVVAWFFVKSFWNAPYATAAIALIAGFASLHDSGRRVMGDIPGFSLLLLGLLLLLKKNKPYISGVFFGLAVAAKPSVYLLVIPALILMYSIGDLRSAFRKLLPIGIGAIAPIGAWIILQFPHPFQISTWQQVFSFYQNAFGSVYSPWVSIARNMQSFFSQTTLIYFSILALPTLFAFRDKLVKRNPLTLFIFIYGILDFLYFLKSPGTIRYLLPLQLWILILLPITTAFLLGKIQFFDAMPRKISLRYLWFTVIGGLSALHLVQFLFFSNVVVNNTAHLQTLKFLNRYTTEIIGVISSPHIAAFLPPERKLHYIRETDQIIFGTNPLDLPISQLPDVLVIPKGYEQGNPLSPSQTEQLRRYSMALDGKWQIYTRNDR